MDEPIEPGARGRGGLGNRPRLLAVPILLVALMTGACKSNSAPAADNPDGCESHSYNALDYLNACTRIYGTTFELTDGVQDDLARIGAGERCGYELPGNDAPEQQPIASIKFVKQLIWRARATMELDLMIDRDPLPGTNTYRIYRKPRDADDAPASPADGAIGK